MPDCLHIKGRVSASPLESTYTDGCTYPDPTGFGTQTLQNDAYALPKSSHQYSPYFETSASNANEVEPVDPFAGNEYWSKQSWDADEEQYLADLDPFSEATQNSAIQSDSQSNCQLSTGAAEQTREAFPFSTSTFRQANVPVKSANTVASDNTYSVGYPFRYAPEYISNTAVSPGQRTASTFRQANVPAHSTNTVASDSIYSVNCPSRYAPSYISYPGFPPGQPFGGTSPYIPESSSPYALSDATQTALQSFHSSRASFENPTQKRPDDRGLDKRNRSQLSATKRKQQGRKRAVVAPPLRRSHRTRLPRATTTSAAATSGTGSVLGRHKAELGAAMGSDYRLRENVKVENGLLYGLVDNQWRKPV